MSALNPNLVIGNYKLLRLLGEGGMGEVWLGSDQIADRKVALKFIKPFLLAEHGFRNRFINEAKTLGKLEHDRIVTLYNVLDEGDYLALVLRFIDGHSLGEKIDAQRAMALDSVLGCARDILPALEFAHNAGIIHRDIKPPNILVDGQNRYFLMDFGIAVTAFAERGTMTGHAIGTPEYMSPEQIRTPQAIRQETGGHRTDIYSFGVVLFEMLSGRVPFGPDSGMEDVYSIQHAHCNLPPPPLRTVSTGVSAGVEAVIMACLEKDPANRPQTCLELLAELERAAEGSVQSVRTHPATIVEARSSPEAKVLNQPIAPVVTRGKVPPQVWYGLGAVCIAGGIGLAVVTHPEKPKSPEIVAPIHETFQKPSTKTKATTDLTANSKTQLPIQPPPQNTPDPVHKEAASEYLKAKDLYAQGNYCGAKDKVDQAIKADPRPPEYAQLRSEAASGCDTLQ